MKPEAPQAPDATERGTIVPSLLQAIVRLNAEVVVMHVGERPYVITPLGQVDLATRDLTLDAVSGIVQQLLPSLQQQVLAGAGGVRHELETSVEFPDDRFTIVVAAAQDDMW